MLYAQLRVLLSVLLGTPAKGGEGDCTQTQATRPDCSCWGVHMGGGVTELHSTAIVRSNLSGRANRLRFTQAGAVTHHVLTATLLGYRATVVIRPSSN